MMSSDPSATSTAAVRHDKHQQPPRDAGRGGSAGGGFWLGLALVLAAITLCVVMWGPWAWVGGAASRMNAGNPAIGVFLAIMLKWLGSPASGSAMSRVSNAWLAAPALVLCVSLVRLAWGRARWLTWLLSAALIIVALMDIVALIGLFTNAQPPCPPGAHCPPLSDQRTWVPLALQGAILLVGGLIWLDARARGRGGATAAVAARLSGRGRLAAIVAAAGLIVCAVGFIVVPSAPQRGTIEGPQTCSGLAALPPLACSGFNTGVLSLTAGWQSSGFVPMVLITLLNGMFWIAIALVVAAFLALVFYRRRTPGLFVLVLATLLVFMFDAGVIAYGYAHFQDLICGRFCSPGKQVNFSYGPGIYVMAVGLVIGWGGAIWALVRRRG